MALLGRGCLIAAAAHEATAPAGARAVAPTGIAVTVRLVVIITVPWHEPVMDRRRPAAAVASKLIRHARHPVESLDLRGRAGGVLRGERVLLDRVQVDEDREVRPLEAVDARRALRKWRRRTAGASSRRPKSCVQGMKSGFHAQP
jgi:hypothetical protein